MAASSRVIANNAFRANAALMAIVSGRIREASSVDKQSKRPLIVIRAHTGFPVGGFDGTSFGRREYLQVWAHDDPGDYQQIDEILRLCRVALEGVEAFDDFFEAKWIETGVDLRDDRMESITRYTRFQFTFARRETL